MVGREVGPLRTGDQDATTGLDPERGADDLVVPFPNGLAIDLGVLDRSLCLAEMALHRRSLRPGPAGPLRPGVGDLDGIFIGPVPHEDIDELQLQHVQQSVRQAFGDATRVGLGPDDRQHERAARSLRPRRSCWTSDVLAFVSDIGWPQWPGAPASASRRSARPSRLVAGAELAEEFVGLHEKWVLVEKPVDDDQRMGAEDIHHDAGAEFGEVVRADDKIVVPG